MSTDTITRDEVDELRRDRDNYRTQCNLARKERAEAIASLAQARELNRIANDNAISSVAQIDELRAQRDTTRADLARANESATLYLDTFRSESAINRELRAQVVTLDALLNPNPSNPMKPKIGA